MQEERYQSQINQNFETVCHTEVCFPFSRLAAKLSEMIAKFWGRSLKIQSGLSFDLNGLKNCMHKYFENSLKSFQIFQILMGGMNFRERLQKTKRPQHCVWDPAKKGQWPLHIYSVANFVASWLQMIWNDSKWISMCLKNQLKSFEFI